MCFALNLLVFAHQCTRSQTLFLATRGATEFNMSYCTATEMVHTRVGFVLSSYCTVRDIR